MEVESQPAPVSDRIRVRKWIQKLNTSDLLAFSGQDELQMLLDLYDGNSLHPIQYHFDSRFKGRLPISDASLCVAASENADSCRSQENFPTDEGLLKTKDGRFFNASTIEGKDRTYIATQHPLPSTVLDFWKMVLAEKPDIVVMLNKYEYDLGNYYPNEPELVQYWPGTSKSGFIDTILLEDKESGGTVKISVLPEPLEHDIEELETNVSPNSAKRAKKSASKKDTNNDEAPPALDISSQPKSPETDSSQKERPGNDESVHITAINSEEKEEEEEEPEEVKKPPHVNGKEGSSGNGYQEYKLNSHIEYSKLLVEYNGMQHQLWHIRCGGWKDQEAPDLNLFMDLWNLVQEKLKTHKSNGEKHKIVIHCTGGVGRTGTFIAVDIAGQELKEKQKSGKWEEFSIEKVIHFLRKKRMNMVGSVSQYVFCHRAALTLFGGLPPEKE